MEGSGAGSSAPRGSQQQQQSGHQSRSAGGQSAMRSASRNSGRANLKRHEGQAQPNYFLAKPGDAKRQIQYRENPFLLRGPNMGKTCLSFGYPRGGMADRACDFHWKEDDRDTANGRCKFNHDCRFGGGAQHTGKEIAAEFLVATDVQLDPKPKRIWDRMDSLGRAVVQAKEPNVMQQLVEPFKGAGGAKTPGWSPAVEMNLGHGHGANAFQQHRGPLGRNPLGQAGKRYPFTQARQNMVESLWRAVVGGSDRSECSLHLLLTSFNPRSIHEVVARQLTPKQAEARFVMALIKPRALSSTSQSDMRPATVGYESTENRRGNWPFALDGFEQPDDEIVKEADSIKQSSPNVTKEDFKGFWERASDVVSDDGFFALLLHNCFR
ncbi:hypothetical protein GUITHDRAFT_111597 [Guillardia theta CCMP2712]|uniref:Uncharacterized protein n=1 Tax=Guillardia theta (strain CCMP2712) TaxID=905079 RepID=L1J211_GUITC|nr:hypothetical protein GUITHDRAFT_111597 [Guillardia theta CCMP2712]EKX42322.1 hypothetical protein GUITHDRAFT_111597 [Guillardia theta CCMP2712]|eukprot:XP_005829302.1 hypothetical protein GUITHDRAFT_111597 [Guillardia theta CCMP2712]